MSEGPAFHTGCGGRLSFDTDLFGQACEMCDRCDYAALVGRRDPTPEDAKHRKGGIQKQSRNRRIRTDADVRPKDHH